MLTTLLASSSGTALVTRGDAIGASHATAVSVFSVIEKATGRWVGRLGLWMERAAADVIESAATNVALMSVLFDLRGPIAPSQSRDS